MSDRYVYCFYHDEEKHIHVIMSWNGVKGKYLITGAFDASDYAKVDEFPYRKRDSDYKLINRILGDN